MNSSRVILGQSKNGITVWYDKDSSHTATHIQDTPELKALAAEVVKNCSLQGDFMQFHTDMGRTVGYTDLVDIGPGDKIVYAKRLNRENYTVFNLSKQPQPCPLVTTAFERRDDNTYELVSTWIGPSDFPSLPGSKREGPQSEQFWTSHALAWGTQEIQPDTQTNVRPW